MSAALTLARPAVGDELVRLAAEMYELVSTAELLHGHPKLQAQYDRVRDWSVDLAERFEQFRDEARHELGPAMDSAVESLQALGHTLSEGSPRTQQIKARWKSLSHGYEELLVQIRKMRLEVPRNLRLGHVKPKNYGRNLFHVANGVVAIFAFETFLTQSSALLLAGALLLSFIAMDVARRVSPYINENYIVPAFGKIARPSEHHKVPAATWYLVALMIGVAVLPRYAIEVGAIVLALGDPAASLAGKRWGKRKLVGDKSLVGSIAFVIVGTLSTIALLLLVGAPFSLFVILKVALLASFAGALAELGSDRLDDNFTVPLIAGGVAALLL